MRTTKTASGTYKGQNAEGIFAPTPSLEEALQALLLVGPMTGLELRQRLRRNVGAAIAALRNRQIIGRRARRIVVAPFPFAAELLDYLEGERKERSANADAFDESLDVAHATRMLFHSKLTVPVLSAVLDGPTLASSFRASHSMVSEARRLVKIGILSRSKIARHDVYALNGTSPKVLLLRRLISAIIESVPQLAWTARGSEIKSFGQFHPNAKLTDRDVHSIRRQRANGEAAKDIAAQYGISDVYVRALANGKYRRYADS